LKDFIIYMLEQHPGWTIFFSVIFAHCFECVCIAIRGRSKRGE